MVLTPSLMAQLGTQAPDFRLTDVVSGKGVTRDSAKGPKGLLAGAAALRALPLPG